MPQNPRPSLFDITGRAKWDAWSNTGKAYAGNGLDAERRYLDVARELGWAPGSLAGVMNGPQEEGEVWDEDLGMSILPSSTEGKGGMGGSVSAMTASRDEGNDTGGPVLHAFAIQGDVNSITRFLVENSSADVDQRDEYVCTVNTCRFPGDDTPCRAIQHYTWRVIEATCQ